MPTFKKSKQKRGLFNDSLLNQAVLVVIDQKMSVREAGNSCGIDGTTVGRYVKKAKTSDASVIKHSMVIKQVSNV